MWYLYDDLSVLYPLLIAAAHKAESEYEDRLRKEAQVRLAQAAGEDEIMTFREQIMQLWVVMQKPPVRISCDHFRQLSNRNSKNRNVNNTRGNGNGKNFMKGMIIVRYNVSNMMYEDT